MPDKRQLQITSASKVLERVTAITIVYGCLLNRRSYIWPPLLRCRLTVRNQSSRILFRVHDGLHTYLRKTIGMRKGNRGA